MQLAGHNDSLYQIDMVLVSSTLFLGRKRLVNEKKKKQRQYLLQVNHNKKTFLNAAMRQ